MHKRFYFKIFSQGPVQDHARQNFTRASTRSFSQGPLQDLLTRTYTRSYKDLLERTSQGSPQDLLTRMNLSLSLSLSLSPSLSPCHFPVCGWQGFHISEALPAQMWKQCNSSSPGVSGGASAGAACASAFFPAHKKPLKGTRELR